MKRKQALGVIAAAALATITAFGVLHEGASTAGSDPVSRHHENARPQGAHNDLQARLDYGEAHMQAVKARRRAEREKPRVD